MSISHVIHDRATLGMRVQDYWGRTGTIRWIGKIDKKDHSPTRETGRFFGIEYDEESRNELRSNGTWLGKEYFTCEPAKGMLCKPADIFPEINPRCIKEMRERFGDEVKDWHDFELVKFCIARKFHMPKAIEMLENHLKWRSEFKPSHEEYFPQTIVEDYPAGYSGACDRDENIIYCERPSNAGHCHPSDFVKRYTLPVIARWHACGMEMGIQRMRTSNYRSKRVCYIVDLLNVKAMTRPMIGFAQTLATVEQNNYPENIGRVFIVNCPGFFRYAWKLVKIFIDERTNKKINFVAPNKAIEPLKEVMDEKDIPDFCGGTSRAWMETNAGMLGSSDPSKAFSGDGAMPTGTEMELENLQDEVEHSEGDFEAIGDDEVPTPTAGSPNALNPPETPQSLAKSEST